MKTKLFLLFVLAMTGSLTAQDYRQWKDNRGNVIDARLIKDNGNGTITILKRDGWQGDVPLNLLSAADQEFVRAAASAGASTPAKPVLSEKFEVFRIRQEKIPGYIATKNGWEHKIECIQAELRFHGSAPVKEAFAKAYFYDKDGKEIERFASPPRRQDESGEYVTMPEKFEPGGKYQVYFPISMAINERRWKTVLVVFGNDSEVGALSDPKAGWLALDFDEKKTLFPGWEPVLAEKMAPATATPGQATASVPLVPEMKTIKRGETPLSTFVDKAWRDKVDSLTTEIRVKGSLPEKVSVSAYYFNEAKSLVATKKQPALTNLGNSTYVGLPKVASDNRWYPVYFPFDEEIRNSKWNWAVIVFTADGRSVANLFGPNGVALTDLNFPGKETL